jgi:hypothetical protein
MIRDTINLVSAPPVDRVHLHELIRRRALASRAVSQGWFAGGRQPRNKEEAALWTNQELTKLFRGENKLLNWFAQVMDLF